MEILDKENQFLNQPILLPTDRNFFVFVGANNSGKSTLLRSVIKTYEKELSYLVNVNRTVLTGEGSRDKGYLDSYQNYVNRALARVDDNFVRETQPLQDFFNLKDKDRAPVIEWYNKYFPNQITEEREDPENIASPMLLKMNGFSLTKQGSGVRSTLEIFIKLLDPSIKILCIDEPELGLEPYLQKYLFKALKDKSSADKKIILATHSHHFLDLEDIENNYTCQRNADGKIFISKVDDIQPVIFRLLGNSLSSFLLPENILVLEGPSDTTFINKCLTLLCKKSFSVHNSGGSGSISYAINSITQFLTFHATSLPVYKEHIYVLADKPTSGRIIVEEWKTLLWSADRLKVLNEDAIEYFYPEHILQEIFNSNKPKQTIVSEYLRNKPNGFNDKTIPKTNLAKTVVEKLDITDLDDPENELFVFIKSLP